MSSNPLRHVQEAVFQHITLIAGLFKPGAKVTVLVRFPDLPDRDFIVTTDEIPDVAAMVERRRSTTVEERVM